MITKKMRLTERRLNVEYPVFEGEGAEAANRFSERLSALVAAEAARHPEYRYSLSFNAADDGEKNEIAFTLSVKKPGAKTLRKSLYVTFSHGYIKKYEEKSE